MRGIGKLIMRDPDGEWRKLFERIAHANGLTAYADGLKIAGQNEQARIERKQARAQRSEVKE
jgi:hypothetical protein